MNLFDALMGFAAGLMVGITAALWATYYDMKRPAPAAGTPTGEEPHGPR